MPPSFETPFDLLRDSSVNTLYPPPLLFTHSCSPNRANAEMYRKGYYHAQKRECPNLLTLDGHRVGFVKGGSRNMFPELDRLNSKLGVRPEELDSQSLDQNPVLRVTNAAAAAAVRARVF